MKMRYSRALAGGFAGLGLLALAPSSSYAQAPSLGTAGTFAVLAGSAVTNTGPSVINGDVGVWPSNAVTGFPPGIVVTPYSIHMADAVAQQAEADALTAYNVLSSTPITTNLTGQDLGGKTLIAGVYGFNTSAQLTGTLTLNAQGNPNAVFIVNVGSTLTTASASNVVLENGAQGSHVFFRVGSSATLGTSTSFVGDIIALTSITLDTAATINCGAALALNGAVTLDNNVISVCTAMSGGGGMTATGALPAWATGNQRAVGNAIDAYLAGGSTLPGAFLNLLMFGSSTAIANAFTELSGEAATGAAQAATQSMNSFLSLVISPFSEVGRPINENRGGPAMYVKAKPFEPTPDPRRWGVWSAAYGDKSSAEGDPNGVGSHTRSISNYGYVAGVDYRLTPDTVAGVAFGGGETQFGLSQGLGGGRSEMLQAAAYASTHFYASYFSAAVAYAWHHVSTNRDVSVPASGLGDYFTTADYSAQDVGARIEGGYRFAVPRMFGWVGGWGFTPYAAGQVQSYHSPSYSEQATSGSPVFALAYNAQTANTARSEAGARFDWTMPVDTSGALVTLRSRAAWAHDEWSKPEMTAMFQALPGPSFVVTGAAPAHDSLLASGGAEMDLHYGFSVAAWFDGEFAEHGQKYTGTARVRYIW